MKPISLKLSGLQSYRSMQEIDFTALCDTGLFGIFGPTGSGKSTILDAVTLAMYGKVGRASGGTQGIMNHSEDTLFVAFTFELASARGKERYRVERRFKRQSDISVSNTISRFIEVSSDGDKVIADKLADVTRCVEEKIGLKMDDFTRAVVLPQGKFAEFMSLKGAERRAMLQRLFHLEKYGDLLAQKLSRKVKENENALNELAAEQQGLGDASEAVLREAAAAQTAAAALAATRRRELAEAQQRSDQLAKVRELSLERSARAAQLAELREQDGAVAELEAALAAAAAAERIRPALTAWKEAQQLAAERAAAAGQAREAAAAAEDGARAAAEVAEAAAAELGREEPVLLLRLDQLEQAKALQAECDQLLLEAEQLQASREQGGAEQQRLHDELRKQEQLLVKAQQRRQELEEQLNQSEVKPADRRRLQDAVTRQQGIVNAREALSRAEADVSGLASQSEGANARLAALTQEEADCGRERLNLADKAWQAYAGLDSLESASLALAKRTERYEAALKRSAKERDEQQWSRRLAEALHSGQPCPVCGSMEHPAPAEPGKERAAVDEWELELKEIGSLLLQVRELRYAISRNRDSLRNLLQALGAGQDASFFTANEEAAAALSIVDSDTGQLKRIRDGEIVEAAGFVEAEEFTESAVLVEAEEVEAVTTGESAALRKDYAALSEELAEWQAKLEHFEHNGKTVSSKLAELQSKLASAKAEATSIAGLLEQSAQKSQLCREELAERMKQWDLEHPDLSPEEATARMEQIHERDSLAEDIKQRIALSVPFMEEKSAAIVQLQRDINELDKSLLQWDVQNQGKQELLQDKRARLKAWIGDGTVDLLHQEAEQRLASLRTLAESGKRRQADAELHRQECAKADVLAQQAALTAQEQESKLLERWRVELAASPFDNEQQAAAAIMEEKRMISLEQQIKSHRDAERELMITIKELDTKLENRSVTEEEWEQCCAALSLAKELDEAALQLNARLQRDLEDLEKRHVRWKELESLRLKREHEGGLLGKLQSALRGNAFVEYVAEEQLMNVSQAASQRLRYLTNQRYALECDSGGGFVIRDDANGGVKRPVATLSGGETFLTSLALALALSAQIQLRGQYPLQFFFLDEGFGTLDPELLDTVITSLEHLHHDHLSVGIISHVAELRARLARKLIIIPAESGGEGSRVTLESL
ncbi:AAA family ATPase [Paenibacillus fonticola]|uniref:AAA family ATPase n=1 Tax=Paenibacillus fonticola TaxID=379896 RepID=UPI00037AC00F|nr:AAA family ATPase [Paenibacillus fonticola]